MNVQFTRSESAPFRLRRGSPHIWCKPALLSNSKEVVVHSVATTAPALRTGDVAIRTG